MSPTAPTPTADSEAPTFLFRGGEDWRSPWDDYRRLRDETPLLRVDQNDKPPFWVLSRFSDVFDAVRDTTAFSSASGLTPMADETDMFDGMAAPIVMLDPPDHTAMRRLVSKAMTPRRVAHFEGAVTDFVTERVDTIDPAQSTDIVATLFKPLPSFVVAHYLGVPEEDRSRFDGWTEGIVAASAGGDLAVADVTADLFDYALDLIERRRLDPGDDLVSDLVELGEETVSAMWIVGFVFTMVTGGNDTTTGLLSGAVELLTSHRSQRELLLDDPDRLPDALEEFLRMTTPVQNLARTTTIDVELHGQTVPKGDKVLLLYGAANRDDREFGPTAEDLDIERAAPRHLTFGYGAHHCLGAAAARLQARVALAQLLDRFPDFEVDPARGNFANGPFVRRYQSLPFIGRPDPARS